MQSFNSALNELNLHRKPNSLPLLFTPNEFQIRNPINSYPRSKISIFLSRSHLGFHPKMSVLHQLISSNTNFSYQKLKQQKSDDDHHHLLNLGHDERCFQRVLSLRSRKWYRFGRVHIRKRIRVKVPSLTRFMRKKMGLIRLSCANILKRLKQSQAHFGDIFAGNYLFLQVNPASVNCIQKALQNHRQNQIQGNKFISS